MSEETRTGRSSGESGPSSAARVRSRLVRFGVRGSQGGTPALEPVLQAVRTNHPKSDLSVIERAYATAEKAHRGQMRKSGDPYITHPVAVATILADLGFDGATLAAALLHDTVEDTEYSLERLTEEYGEEIAMLVDGVTKLDKVTYGDAAQAETVRKMVVAMARDIRVLVIKLADRLHNARTWKFVPSSSAERKARETLEIYAPLAHRLGMNTIKWELEDLSFATLYPKVYEEIVHLVAERAPAREEYLAVVREQVTADLRTAKIKATVTGRPKHYYSIYQKMIVRGHDFAEIYDLVGARVLVDTVRDCYAALGALHARWNPVPGRFKDYIAMPKFNMYQSLHTTVIGPGGKPVEIQIRTHDMHRRAEYGVAAHWKYKEIAKASGAPEPAQNDMAWLRQLVDWQRETADPSEFLDSLRFEIGGAEVYVFTPKGDVIALPAGSTPVDFAYAVHTEVGHRTMGARVNGRLVPLDSTLENGDVVDVLTSKSETAGPSRDWLAFVNSPRARNKIRQWFSKERREEAVEHGKDRDRQGDAQAEPADPAPAQRTSRSSRSPTRCATRTSRRCTPRSARDRSRLRASCRSSCTPWAARTARPRTSRRSRAPGTPRAARARATRAWSSRAWTTSGSSSPSAAPRCRATRSSASSRAGRASASTARTAPTSSGCATSPSASSTSTGPRAATRSSWSRSRSRHSTVRVCSRT